MDLSAFGVAARRLLISTFISILVTFAIPIALHNVDVANAQTKTCGTPGGPLCPKSLPQPEPWAYGLLGYGGVGPFSSKQEAKDYIANVDEPHNSRCTPTFTGEIHPGPYFGEGYMYTPGIPPILLTPS